MKMFQRPYMALVNEGKSTEEAYKEIYEYDDHCPHCPSQKAWYVSIHRTMEDDTYSTLSWIIGYFITFLIAASTFTYVFQTIPQWESWSGWQLLEGIVSLIFTMEFFLRIMSCR